MHSTKKNNRIWPYIIAGFFLLIFIFGFFAYRIIIKTDPAKIFSIPAVQSSLKTIVGKETAELLSDMPEFLGMKEPRTYLLLFLNNTELRPGGGFIGSYAVLRFENGHPAIMKVEGTETIDRLSDRTLLSPPPEPLSRYVGVDYLYFRDSNWSPDFAVSSKNALDLYKKENGPAIAGVDSIDAVIGVTTHVLEEIMKRTGQISISGIEFNSENVIEKLEYEVEYGYKDRGIGFRDRKQVLGEFMREISRRLGSDLLTHAADYKKMAEKLTTEKHIMAWSPRAELQKKFLDYGWSGVFAPTSTDYVFWIDANVAALKTDYAVERDLKYELGRDVSGNYIATTTMIYTNNGEFDWRTTRYRTFARLYVPAGARLTRVIGAKKWDRTTEPGIPTVGEELGSTVFGAFISIEPGTNGALSFVYTLPETVAAAIQKGEYSLSVPKQLGTVHHGLTLDLDFDTTIRTAIPAENPENWGNSHYTYTTDLRVDRFFEVGISSLEII